MLTSAAYILWDVTLSPLFFSSFMSGFALMSCSFVVVFVHIRLGSSFTVEFTSAFAPSAQRRQARKRRKLRRPPAVDSTLLRFLDEERRLQQQERPPRQRTPNVENSETSGRTLFYPEGILRNSTAEFDVVSDSGYRNGSATTTGSWEETFPLIGNVVTALASYSSTNSLENTVRDTFLPERGADIDETLLLPKDSWLGQYNRNRVAAVLKSKATGDLGDNLALQAGQRVQSQALARTARRRVRDFLKQRDQVWSANGHDGAKEKAPPLPTANSLEGNSETSPDPCVMRSNVGRARSTAYSFEETIDVFLAYGLTVKDVAEVLTHSPGIALMRPTRKENSNGESLEETLERVLTQLLCGTLQLRRYDARKVLRNSPGLLTMRGSQAAANVVQLVSQLGLSTNALARDKAALPTMLSRSPDAIFRLVAFLSSDAVRMPVDKIGPLLRKPSCHELLDVVAPVTRHQDSEEDQEDDDLIRDITSTDPNVVSALWGRSSQLRRIRINQVYRDMTDTAWTLRHEIGTEDLGKVIAAYPAVLLLDAKTEILPTARYLMEELGIWEDDLPRVLQLYPALLGMRVHDMERVVEYLVSLEVAPENLASIFRSFPSLLTLDVEADMLPVVNFLRSVGISNVGRFVSRLPPVLGYSVEKDLQPKWRYLESVVTDPRFEVSKFPAYFSYPLERVIQTRFEYLQQVKNIPTPLVALDHVLRFGDKDFSVKVAGDRDDGSAFRSYTQTRQKERATQGRSPKRGQREPSRSSEPSRPIRTDISVISTNLGTIL